MSDAIKQAGWYADPTGRFTERYFDGSTWTERVATDGDEASDPLKAPPVRPPAALALPDDRASKRRRQMLGGFMLAAVGLVLLSLALPWVSGAEEYSEGSPKTLAGYQYGTGLFVAIIAIGLVAYAAQAFARSRVRFHVAALVALVFMVMGTLLHANYVQEDDLDQLGVSGSSAAQSEELFGGVIEITSGGAGDDADRIENEIGINVAVLAGFAAIVPFALLWRDDRSRRRNAGLLV